MPSSETEEDEDIEGARSSKESLVYYRSGASPAPRSSTKEGRGAVLAQVDSRIAELLYGARTVFVPRQDSDHFWDAATMP